MGLSDALPIDPLTLHADAVVDATGHDAALVAMLRRRGRNGIGRAEGEGPMHAVEGEPVLRSGRDRAARDV
jgi:ribulose 1,5-bisphosphate synthetase/thiazole synthase